MHQRTAVYTFNKQDSRIRSSKRCPDRSDTVNTGLLECTSEFDCYDDVVFVCHHSTFFLLSVELRGVVRLTDGGRKKCVGEHIPARNKSTISLYSHVP